ncbi:hypothetical protein [Streptomyces sioyaensis]
MSGPLCGPGSHERSVVRGTTVCPCQAPHTREYALTGGMAGR